jgi:hypothetical protein
MSIVGCIFTRTRSSSFLSSARTLQFFYIDYLDRKLSALHGIVTQADANIRHYDHSIVVSNANLTRSWQEQHNQLMALRSQADKDYPALAARGNSKFRPGELFQLRFRGVPRCPTMRQEGVAAPLCASAFRGPTPFFEITYYYHGLLAQLEATFRYRGSPDSHYKNR